MSTNDPNEELELAIMEEALAKPEGDEEAYVMVGQQAQSHDVATDNNDGWLKLMLHKVERIKLFWADVLDEMKTHREATSVSSWFTMV